MERSRVVQRRVNPLIRRHRSLRAESLSRGLALYLTLTALATAGYACMVAGLSYILGEVIEPTNPWVIGFAVLLLALGLNPLRSYLQRQIDGAFFRSHAKYLEQQRAFGRELPQSQGLGQIFDLLRRYVNQALHPADLHIYYFDPTSNHFVAAFQDSKPSSDIRFSPTSPLAQELFKAGDSLYLSDLKNLPASLQAEQARIALLGAQHYVPMPGKDRIAGWLAVSRRRSGERYTPRDLEFLKRLCDQTSLAVERAQAAMDLERRMREMNALTRITQGISFTIVFDDILELITAQISQILPARDLRFTLSEPKTGALYHAFYVENDERVREREGQPLPQGLGLEAEIIGSQRLILTNDYERECRLRGLLPATAGVYAWMGVPLNAGAHTIGLLSVGSRDPGVIYTDDQANLLQAIADQAAGAIVKARLLEESDRRARELATLNEIGISLTSTLDLKRLLHQILESAAEILNCEAGSLFLVDEQTDELVFEVVLGPVAADLTGKRLPSGTGLAGQAVQTGKPIVANDARLREDWFEKTDEQTGFITQHLLVVPMRIQERVIGVIEVINKRDGLPFTVDEQELLTAFTNQATIAIENARLYTLTDQALAARVEELSVLQRIDRELNASLDLDRVLRITLDWAMRQSRFEAGLVGMVKDSSLQVMTALGYPMGFGQGQPSDGDYRVLSADLPGLRRAIETGQVQRLSVAESVTQEGFSILENACQQVVIPIHRETEIISVLILESAHLDTTPEDLLNFLDRLSDHAAIAIANGQLYEEVKEANLAKSRFVSFVAHELRNPMASIKGYTELVAGGMAGPINEMQSSFLATVRSNVDRMNTIVTDLNDLTKIETGNLRLDYQAVQINEILEDVIRSISRQVEVKSQQLEVQLPDNLPTAWADPARLNQILTNLVSNAHKYTLSEGKLTVGAERYSDSNGSMAGTQFIHIWVQDTGIGIAEDDQKNIFQQYFRTETAKEMSSGTGLGLAVTKSLVEMQGGRIWFESKEGLGSTFHFSVPVVEIQ